MKIAKHSGPHRWMATEIYAKRVDGRRGQGPYRYTLLTCKQPGCQVQMRQTYPNGGRVKKAA